MDVTKELMGEVIVYGGSLTGVVFMGLAILRTIGLRASKDAITIKEDAAHRDTISMLQNRINLLDTRLTELETSRNKLMSLTMRLLSFITTCSCYDTNEDNPKQKIRLSLESEFSKILDDELVMKGRK